MDLKAIEDELNKFGKYVIQQARTRLTREKRNSSKTLYNSLAMFLDKDQNRRTLSFEMEDYGMFQDRGVKGANPSLVKNGKQKAPNSPFKYRNKYPPLDAMIKFAKARKIRFRNEQGQFITGNYQSVGFWLQKRIFAQGIKPSLFFTVPFQRAYKNLPPDIAAAFGNDLGDFLNDILD